MSLKFYSEERARHPEVFAIRVNADQAAKIVAECVKALGYPPVKLSFTDRKNSSGPEFAWNWYDPGVAPRITLGVIESVGNILHEIAHYLDYLDRVRQLLALDPSGRNGTWPPSNSS